MMDEAGSWKNNVSKRLKSNEMLFDDGINTIMVEIHPEWPKIHDLETCDLETHVKLVGHVEHDDHHGLDTHRVEMMEGHKPLEASMDTIADDGILGQLISRLHSRFPSLHITAYKPKEAEAASVNDDDTKPFEYHVFIEIPKHHSGTDGTMKRAIRQELAYIQESMQKANGGPGIF